MKKIYLDYSATSPVDSQVLEAMAPFWQEDFGNPSSLHGWGQRAKKALEKSRQTVADFLNCSPEEVIFTSGASEANNLALKGTVEAWQRKNPGQKPHLIVSPIEHHCVLDSAKHLQKQGAEVSWLKVDQHGLVEPRQLKKLIKKNTVLVSVMYANNEVGTIEPVKTISRLIADYQQQTKQKIYFHTDAVQAIQYLNLDVQDLGVDLLSASAHKFYGPKGIGFLFIKKGTALVRQQDGGSQESGRRAGTENVAAIVGLAKALQLAAANKDQEKTRLEKLRDYLIRRVLREIPSSQLTGHRRQRLPQIASFTFVGVEGEALLFHLDDAGIAASSGSACTSGSLEPSHVLLAMRIEPATAHGSLRFSLGKKTSQKDIDYLLKVLARVIKNLRKMAPELKER